MKAVVAAFNQEKALVGAFSVITNLRMDFFQALDNTYALLSSGPGQGAADQLQDGGRVNHDDQGNVT